MKRTPSPRVALPIAALALLLLPALLHADDGLGPVAGAGTATVLLLGLVYGLKHALDTDHLVAVASMVSERFTPRAAARIGIEWGMGHTLSLLLAGGAILLFRPQLPEPLMLGLEFVVGAMIVGLGVRLLWRVLGRGETLRNGKHTHGAVTHSHPYLTSPAQPQSHTLPTGRRPFFVGMVHGLAGSASLALLVVAGIPSISLGIIYLAVFGLGSIVGMMVMSAAMALPMTLAARRIGRFERRMQLAAGALGIAFGIVMMYSIGVEDGLFSALFQ